jgi:hypothetical protein
MPCSSSERLRILTFPKSPCWSSIRHRLDQHLLQRSPQTHHQSLQRKRSMSAQPSSPLVLSQMLIAWAASSSYLSLLWRISRVGGVLLSRLTIANLC